MSYDARLFEAKHRATRTLCAAISGKADLTEVGSAIDDLNKAWDELTDALVRQRKERDLQIIRLIDELAEARKGR